MDGIITAATSVCIGEADRTTFVNLNATDATFQSVATDISAHDCSPDPLPGVSFDAF